MIGRVLVFIALASLAAGPAYAEETQSLTRQLLVLWFPLLIFIGLWIYFIRKFGFGSKQRELIERYPAHMEALERKLDRIIELLEDRSQPRS